MKKVWKLFNLIQTIEIEEMNLKGHTLNYRDQILEEIHSKFLKLKIANT